MELFLAFLTNTTVHKEGKKTKENEEDVRLVVHRVDFFW